MRTRIAVLYNQPGESRYNTLGESRAVAGVLDAVKAVSAALQESGHEVSQLPLIPPLSDAAERLSRNKPGLVFNLFEGFGSNPETEAELPELLEELGIPYTGCPAGILKLAHDKPKTKIILKSEGINTPDFQLLKCGTLNNFRLRYPCIVKPRGEDASHGIIQESVVYDFASLKKQIFRVSNSYGDTVLVEEFVDGPEFNATIIGNDDCIALPPSEIAYSLPPGLPRILTFSSKWDIESVYYKCTTPVCPARISSAERDRIAETATRVFRLFRCRGYARVDMRMDEKGELHVIELNPNPDISPDSGAARQAAAAGMTYKQFIEKIVSLAQYRKKP